MVLRLVQLETKACERQLAAVFDDGTASLLTGYTTSYELCMSALRAGSNLPDFVAPLISDVPVDYAAALADDLVLPPIEHPDVAHCMVTGTGLTHLGSAAGRNKMHAKKDGGPITDSMKMFNLGLENGKPASGRGVQPEWFYKGNGSMLVRPGGCLRLPSFALDGGEEPECVGVYLIADDGTPHRVGFAIGNEFSDHIMERQNYLYLAHSKLRHCSFGPELLVGDLPADVRGMSRIFRDGELLWEKEFVSGENNMSHFISNLEYHHFKYQQFCRAGDLHVHFFGTATLSFTDEIQTKQGDVFEVEGGPPFIGNLRNTLAAHDYETGKLKQMWVSGKDVEAEMEVLRVKAEAEAEAARIMADAEETAARIKADAAAKVARIEADAEAKALAIQQAEASRRADAEAARRAEKARVEAEALQCWKLSQSPKATDKDGRFDAEEALHKLKMREWGGEDAEEVQYIWMPVEAAVGWPWLSKPTKPRTECLQDSILADMACFCFG